MFKWMTIYILGTKNLWELLEALYEWLLQQYNVPQIHPKFYGEYHLCIILFHR